MSGSSKFIALAVLACGSSLAHGELPPSDKVQPVKLLEVHAYCEGVVFDHDGKGYISHGDRITQFTLDGKSHKSGRRPAHPTGTRFSPTARIWSATPAGMRCCSSLPTASSLKNASDTLRRQADPRAE